MRAKAGMTRSRALRPDDAEAQRAAAGNCERGF
jgi:hypothetical protein